MFNSLSVGEVRRLEAAAKFDRESESERLFFMSPKLQASLISGRRESYCVPPNGTYNR